MIFGNRFYDGAVTWNELQIIWQPQKGQSIIINLKDVAIIGEYTNNTLPPNQDWFLTFVYQTGKWDCISVYAKDIYLLREHLTKLFHTDFQKRFASETIAWKSFIRYPHIIEGKDLFYFPGHYDDHKSKGFILSKSGYSSIFDGGSNPLTDFEKNLFLTEDAKDLLRNSK